METFRYVFSSAEDTLFAVAKRFRTTEERIRDLSSADGQQWADHWLVTIDHFNVLKDGDVLVVPVPEAIPSLPAGADWRLFVTPKGATVRSVMQSLTTPVPGLGRIIDTTDDVVSLIWDNYRNAPVRRAAVQGGRPAGQTSDVCVIPEGSELQVPVFVPLVQTVYAAPSPVSAPQTSATIDVKPDDRFSKLAALLADVERALEDVDAVRARILAGRQTAENICANFIKLKESMEETAEDFVSANAFYADNVQGQQSNAHEGDGPREAAIKAIDPLINKAEENLRGKPVWRKEYPSAESDMKAVTATLKEQIANPELMGLVVDLMPTLFMMPMWTRSARLHAKKKRGPSCLDYVCQLAARAAVALANSPTKADGEVLEGYVGQTKLAGTGCVNLIEYACACTRGFEKTKKRPTSTAPFSCLGVVSTLQMANVLDEVWTPAGAETGEAPESIASRAAFLAFSDLEPLLPKSKEKANERLEELKRELELYSESKEVAEATKEAMDLSETLKPSLANKFLGAILSPFDREGGPVRELIPRSARSFYYAFQTVYEATKNTAKMKESADKESATGIVDTYKSSMEFKKGLLEGAKALEFIEGEGLESAEAAIDLLGRATFLLTVVVEACEAVESAEKGQTKAAAGHVALAGAAICILVGGATAGIASGVFVAVGTILLVGGVVATKGDILIKVYEGETVGLYRQLKGSEVSLWARNFDFGPELAAFQAAFEAADFSAGTAATKRLAVASSTRATP